MPKVKFKKKYIKYVFLSSILMLLEEFTPSPVHGVPIFGILFHEGFSALVLKVKVTGQI